MAQSNKVSIDGLASEMDAILTMYVANVETKTKTFLKALSKETAKEITANVAKAGINDRRKKYAKAWQSTEEHGRFFVHNKSEYRLAHLLEKGHPIVRNGVVVGRARAFPHIKPAEEKLIKKCDDLVKELGEVGV